MNHSKTTKYYWKGQIYNPLPPAISANNSAFLFGESLTTTFLVRQNKVLNLKNHFSRLTESAKFFYDEQNVICWDYFLNALREICGAQDRKLTNGRVKAMLFFSPAYLPSNNIAPSEWSLFLQLDELDSNYFTKKVWNPIKIKSMERQVFPSPGKFGSYGREFALRRKWQKDLGIHDILWKNSAGDPLELTTSAVVSYCNKENKWYFPLNDQVVVESLMAKNFKLFLESNNFEMDTGKCEKSDTILLTMNCAEIFQFASEIDGVSIEMESVVYEKLNQILEEFIKFNWDHLAETI